MAKENKSHGYLKFGEFGRFSAELSAIKHISESSLTIPGQARSIASILAASKFQGGFIPVHGRATFDDSLAAGIARVKASQMSDEELEQVVRSSADPGVKEEEGDPKSPDDDKTPPSAGDPPASE